MAPFESWASWATRAVKSALFSKTAGNAAVSPTFVSSGNSAGAFSPASANVASAFFASSRSNGRFHHVDRNPILPPVRLHQSLAGGDGIVLGNKRSRAERDHRNPKRGTHHH